MDTTTLPAQLKALAALALPVVAGFLAQRISGTTVAGWTTAITYVASGAYFIYDTFVVKQKIVAAFNAPAPTVPAKSVTFVTVPKPTTPAPSVLVPQGSQS